MTRVELEKLAEKSVNPKGFAYESPTKLVCEIVSHYFILGFLAGRDASAEVARAMYFDPATGESIIENKIKELGEA